MTSTKVALCIGLLISFLSVSAYAQSAGPSHFSGELVSFDYPAEYSVTDTSTKDLQQLTITRKGSSVQLAIVAMNRATLQKDLAAATENFKEALLKQVTLTLGGDSPQRTSFQATVGDKAAEGIRLRSARNTGEVIWLRSHLRLVGFALVRSDADEPAGTQLWQTVSFSLKVQPPLITILAAAKDSKDATDDTKIVGGVLNGKALELPPPGYPPIARAAHASGTVKVQVLIDEQGNVVAAHAAEGHPLLQAAAVAAARRARFSPTLLEGEPVRVTGVITYKFVAQF